MLTPALLQTLESTVGSQNLLTSQEDRIAYSYDGTPLLKQYPDAIIVPRSADHISKVLRLANEEGFAVVPRGSGTGLSGGSIPVENCVVLVMSSWNRILEIDRENLTAWVEPGVLTGQVHAEVERLGLLYAPDPGSSSISTIGGNVAENAGGLRGLKYGVTRNYILGMELVLPNGEIITPGGKVMKDVAGYSLKDLMIGSEGTLGVFTKILLRLVPKPEASKTMLAYFDKMMDAANTVAAIIAAKITPSALEFLDNTTVRCVEDYAHLGLPTDIDALLMIEVDGRRGEVEQDAETVRQICLKNAAREVKTAATDAETMKLRAARKVAFTALARVKPTTILEDATVPRSMVPAMLEHINAVARRYDLTFGNFGHAGDGNLHPTCLTDERDASEIKKAEKAFEEIYAKAVELGGTITGEHGVGLSKKKFLEKALGSAAVEAMRAIKAALDPNMVLNPGKIFSVRPHCEGRLPIRRDQIKKFVEMGAYS
jgi:glycolate oxidase